MNAYLLGEDFDDFVYGAVTFREANSTTDYFDYTIHVSQCPRAVDPLHQTHLVRYTRAFC